MLVTGYDRLIDTEVAIPGAMPATLDIGSAEMRITTLSSEPALPMGDSVYHLDGSALVFTAKGVASYRCRPSHVAIAADPAGAQEHVTALLLATALPATLWMAGGFVLHASAVRLPGRRLAVAFSGPSGIGKSTLAGALVEQGSALVADDSLHIAVEGDTAMASGLPAGWFAVAKESGSRFFRAAPPNRPLRKCPLGAIVVLRESHTADVPQLLDRVSATEQLLANRHRPRIPAILGRTPDSLRFCAFLGATVPVYVWAGMRRAATVGGDIVDLLARCVEDEGNG